MGGKMDADAFDEDDELMAEELRGRHDRDNTPRKRYDPRDKLRSRTREPKPLPIIISDPTVDLKVR